MVSPSVAYQLEIQWYVLKMELSGNMSSDSLDSAQHDVSDLLYSAILLVWERMMAYDTEWRAVDRNLAEAAVSDCALFIVVRRVIRLVLRCFFSTSVGVLASFVLIGNT